MKSTVIVYASNTMYFIVFFLYRGEGGQIDRFLVGEYKEEGNFVKMKCVKIKFPTNITQGFGIIILVLPVLPQSQNIKGCVNRTPTPTYEMSLKKLSI